MGTDLTVQKEIHPTFAFLKENQGAVKMRLPEGMNTPDGMVKFMLGISTCLQKNPDLLKCTPESVLLAAYDAAEVGCDLSPSKGLGYLIPYGPICNFQPGYRFFIQKAYSTNDVRSFYAEVVYERDKLDRQYAPKRNLFHAPPDSGERGPKRGAYALIEYVDGSIDWEYCEAELIERHRKHSKQPDSMMWTKFVEEGWRKTPIRILFKRVPLKTRGLEALAIMVDKDAAADTVEVTAGAAATAAATVEMSKEEIEQRARIHALCEKLGYNQAREHMLIGQSADDPNTGLGGLIQNLTELVAGMSTQQGASAEEAKKGKKKGKDQPAETKAAETETRPAETETKPAESETKEKPAKQASGSFSF